MGRLRLAVRVVLAYSRALRTTLAFVGLMVLIAALSAYAGVRPSGRSSNSRKR